MSKFNPHKYIYIYVLTHTNHCIVFDFHSNMSIPLKHETYSTAFLAQKSVMCK